MQELVPPGYLFQSVQSIVEFTLAVESQQPHLLPPGTELVESWISPRNLHGRLLLLLLFACRGQRELNGRTSFCHHERVGKNICGRKSKPGDVRAPLLSARLLGGSAGFLL